MASPSPEVGSTSLLRGSNRRATWELALILLRAPGREDLALGFIGTKNLGMLLLGIWLILMGLVGYVPLIASLGILLNFLAIAAGVLILIGR
jgi:hypothetical protein